MGEKIIVTGAIFPYPSQFGPMLITLPPLTLSGKGFATVNGAKVCHAGDEKQANVASTPYTTATATIAGTVSITITKAQTASVVNSLQPVIIGQQWTALCEVKTMAKVPGNPPVDQPQPPVSQNVAITSNPNTFVTAD